MNKPKYKILVVDDSNSDRELLKEILEQANNEYDVWTVNSGKLALAIMEELHPDLVLLDIQMAEINGFETLIEMKRRGKIVPVLLVSSFTGAGDRAKGLECGAMGFIEKPIDADILREKVADHIRMSREQKTVMGCAPRVGQGRTPFLKTQEIAGISELKKNDNLFLSQRLNLVEDIRNSLLAGRQALLKISREEADDAGGEVKTKLMSIDSDVNQLLKSLEDLIRYEKTKAK